MIIKKDRHPGGQSELTAPSSGNACVLSRGLKHPSRQPAGKAKGKLGFKENANDRAPHFSSPAGNDQGEYCCEDTETKLTVAHFLLKFFARQKNVHRLNLDINTRQRRPDVVSEAPKRVLGG